MKRYLLGLVVLLALAACEDKFRYPCQNPDNFYKPECQKPKCMFTQVCPEYLVAPVLKDQLNAQPVQQPQPEASANR